MNYKLATELKEAGFPMPSAIEIHSQFGSGLTGNLPPTKHEITRYLTLEELIEACIDKQYYFELSCSYGEGKEQWEAYRHNRSNPAYMAKGKGDTADEAVAHLWLMINR